MTADVLICRAKLHNARQDARNLGVKLPKRLTAIRAGMKKSGGEGWFLVESNDGFSQDFWAFNSFDARAKAIAWIIKQENKSVEQ